MSTHNIQFHDKIRKFPLVFDFFSYRKNFVGTQKRVRIIHGKRAIGVRIIEVRLYFTYIMSRKKGAFNGTCEQQMHRSALKSFHSLQFALKHRVL